MCRSYLGFVSRFCASPIMKSRFSFTLKPPLVSSLPGSSKRGPCPAGMSWVRSRGCVADVVLPRASNIPRCGKGWGLWAETKRAPEQDWVEVSGEGGQGNGDTSVPSALWRFVWQNFRVFRCLTFRRANIKNSLKNRISKVSGVSFFPIKEKPPSPTDPPAAQHTRSLNCGPALPKRTLLPNALSLT